VSSRARELQVSGLLTNARNRNAKPIAVLTFVLTSAQRFALRSTAMWSEHGAQDGGLVPGTMVGEYQVERLVGEGGMGQVYGAVHPVIGKRAAIKVLLPEICRSRQMVERFVMEARAVNQIGHPNIVDVFAFGTLPDGRQYMVMEWLKGEALSDRLERGTPSLQDTCEILSGVAAALDAAHEKGIIHRDLKPHNVFLVEVKGSRPLVKLLDFGLVKLMGPEDDGRVERTRSGSVLGTPAYMSPEQALGRTVDTRSDNYSLGVMAFQMVTGRLPFQEDTAMALMVAHMQQPPSLASSVAPNVPPELDQLIYALMAKDPNHRPTMAQTIEMLRYVQGAYAPGYRSSQLPPRPSMPLPAPSHSSYPSHGSHPSYPTAPTWAPPAQVLSTTMGQSVGEQLTARREPEAKKHTWKFALAGAIVVVGASVGIVMATRGGGGNDGSGSGSAATGSAAATQPAVLPDAAIVAVPVDAPAAPAPAIDAAVAQTPPPADAAVAAEVPVDAATEPVAAGTPDPKPKQKPRPKPKPKPGEGSATKPPPPPDDDDGLLQVTPKKK
jgi:serine/threonine-protein kinase